MARVLVVEDDADLCETLRRNLSQVGHRVDTATTGADGLRRALEARPDLVLVDLVLPDTPGTQIVTALRCEPLTQSVPIIVMSGRVHDVDRTVSLELGADDFVAKPFSVRELVARANSLLLRAAAAKPRVMECAELRLDADAHRVTVGNKGVVLAVQEFKLLATLMQRRNHTQSRPTLLSDLWPGDSKADARTVDTHVMRVRDKLGPAGRFIETVRGEGYRFTEEPSKQNGIRWRQAAGGPRRRNPRGAS